MQSNNFHIPALFQGLNPNRLSQGQWVPKFLSLGPSRVFWTRRIKRQGSLNYCISMHRERGFWVFIRMGIKLELDS